MNSALFVRTDYDRSFEFLAYEYSQESYAIDETIALTTYWSVEQPTDNQYVVQLRVTDAARRTTFYQSGYTHAGYFPTNRWKASTIIPQHYEFNLSDELASGNYFVSFDVYVCSDVCSVDIVTMRPIDGQIRILRPLQID
jgi:hypothetical protein